MSDIQKEYKGREAFKHEVRKCQLTLYAVYYVAYIYLKTLDCSVIDAGGKVQLGPLYLETYGVKKNKRNNSRVPFQGYRKLRREYLPQYLYYVKYHFYEHRLRRLFHYAFFIFLSFILCIIFYLVFVSFILQFHNDYT